MTRYYRCARSSDPLTLQEIADTHAPPGYEGGTAERGFWLEEQLGPRLLTESEWRSTHPAQIHLFEAQGPAFYFLPPKLARVPRGDAPVLAAQPFGAARWTAPDGNGPLWTNEEARAYLVCGARWEGYHGARLIGEEWWYQPEKSFEDAMASGWESAEEVAREHGEDLDDLTERAAQNLEGWGAGPPEPESNPPKMSDGCPPLSPEDARCILARWGLLLPWTIEPHGDGWALYHGRDGWRHGANRLHVSQPDDVGREIIGALAQLPADLARLAAHLERIAEGKPAPDPLLVNACQGLIERGEAIKRLSAELRTAKERAEKWKRRARRHGESCDALSKVLGQRRDLLRRIATLYAEGSDTTKGDEARRRQREARRELREILAPWRE